MQKNYRRRVSVVVEKEGAILGFKAIDPHSGESYVFLPGGACEPGETLQETAVRESLEETGWRVELENLPPITRRYDFVWNGQLNDCETTYFKARAVEQEVKDVVDADYHKGIMWVSIEDVPRIFAYHRDILEPIEQLLDR